MACRPQLQSALGASCDQASRHVAWATSRGRQALEPGRDRSEQQALAVPSTRERPRTPREDRLDLDLDREAADDGDRGPHAPSRVVREVVSGTRSGTGAGSGTRTGSGSGPGGAADRPTAPGWARAPAPAATPARSRSRAWEGRCPYPNLSARPDGRRRSQRPSAFAVQRTPRSGSSARGLLR